jgi:hypothetical protein
LTQDKTHNRLDEASHTKTCQVPGLHFDELLCWCVQHIDQFEFQPYRGRVCPKQKRFWLPDISSFECHHQVRLSAERIPGQENLEKIIMATLLCVNMTLKYLKKHFDLGLNQLGKLRSKHSLAKTREPRLDRLRRHTQAKHVGISVSGNQSEEASVSPGSGGEEGAPQTSPRAQTSLLGAAETHCCRTPSCDVTWRALAQRRQDLQCAGHLKQERSRATVQMSPLSAELQRPREPWQLLGLAAVPLHARLHPDRWST